MKAKIVMSKKQAEALLSAVSTALRAGRPPKRIRKGLHRAIETLDQAFGFGITNAAKCEEGGVA